VAEVDVFIENGIYALAVEVKANPCGEDVKEHVQRLEVLRRYADEHGDKRKFLGAVAAPGFPESVRLAAFRAGFFVIEASEDAVNVLAPEGAKVKEW
jgi:TnpA family transposase